MTDTKTPDSFRPGDLVGPWCIEGYAGHGSYGAVYRARRAGHPRSMPVALKIAVFPSDPRFGREVTLLSRNRHPGIPQLLDQGWWHASAEVAHPYFVMEWIRGRTLYEWSRVHNPTCREALRVLAQVAWTLEVLHRSESLHRDVKGDNILVEPEGRAVLTDFGSGTWKGAPPLTEWMVPPNTREYRSPESLSFEWKHWRTQGACYETRPADDLYALGVTAYRLVTGVYPPPGTHPEALKEHLKDPHPWRRPAHEFNRRVAPELSALIERLLAKEPEARGPAQEVAQAAESASEHARPGADAPFLDLEWPEARARAVPVRVVPGPGKKRSASDAESVSAPGLLASGSDPLAAAAPEGVPVAEQTDSGARAWEWRRVLAVAAMSLAVVGPCWMSREPSPGPPQVVQAEAPEAESAPDAGTRGLGDDALMTRAEAPASPITLEAVSREIPRQPLPDQRSPPCQRSWEVVINGGCWKLQAGSAPPCGESEYEWQGACYEPARVRKRVPTSEDPR